MYCGNLYSRYPSLWKHKKKCAFNPKPSSGLDKDDQDIEDGVEGEDEEDLGNRAADHPSS